jgi:hypothetical protein
MRIKGIEYKTCNRWGIQKGGRNGGNCKGKRKVPKGKKLGKASEGKKKEKEEAIEGEERKKVQNEVKEEQERGSRVEDVFRKL